MPDSLVLIVVQLLWIVGAVVWLIRRNDALPLVVSGFLFYVFGFRLGALLAGVATPVMLTPFGFEDLTYASANSAFNLAVLGQCVFLGVYLWYQRASFTAVRVQLERSHGIWLRSRVMLLAAGCIPLVFLTRAYINAEAGAGLSLGFQVSSYAFLFPFVLNSVAILVASLWKAGHFPSAGWKAFALVLLASIAYLSFGSSGRFLFLGWMLAAVFIIITGLPVYRRLLILTAGIAGTLALFSIAGALRNQEEVGEVGLRQSAWERVFSAEDANMLDGLVFIRQIYPERLPYSLGGEHLGVLLRPIPRALWPGKPVGGYINQLGLVDASDGFTLGISPSLFGDFYQEGGWIGIVLFSALYGRGLAWLVVYSARVHVFAGMSIRVILYAFMIPLLRGGDLPGIYAWLGMAFWPYMIFFWLRRREWLTPRRTRKPARKRPRQFLPARKTIMPPNPPATGEPSPAGLPR